MWRQVLTKELRELAASRAWWLMLLATGLLVGHAFTDAMALYAEASGAGGGPAALSQGLSPLTGLVVPVLGAYDLVATFLFPFVVIRVIAEERETGSLALTLQAPLSLRATVMLKGVALLIAWLVALVPGVLALALWGAMGGHLYIPETSAVLLGHVLRGVMTIGIAGAAAALAANASSAAIVALAVTIGAWALDYAAAARGGVLQSVASYTPSAALRVFERGELRAGTILVLLIAGLAGLAVAAEWLRIGRAVAQRAGGVAAVVVLATAACLAASRDHISGDASEDRRNSFAVEDERLLRSIEQPLVVTVHLAAEDPRLVDLERGVLAKLRRVMPGLQVEYAARGRTGLFGAAGDHYGEVWYALGTNRAMSRSATEEIVLETIYGVAGLTPPTSRSGVAYPGYAFTRAWSGTWVVYFIAWPLLVIFLWWRSRRRRIPSFLAAVDSR